MGRGEESRGEGGREESREGEREGVGSVNGEKSVDGKEGGV